MADIYALELALDLDASTPEPVLVLIRDHTEPYPEEDEYEDADADGEYVHPPFKVLAGRRPVYRVGGDCSADLTRAPRGWALTARQEIHAECLPHVEAFLAALTPHLTTSADRPIGSLRFYEDTDPTPTTPDASGAVRLSW